MPTKLGREFPATITTIPTHMSPEDQPLYRRWAIEGLKGAIRQFFDVGLGMVSLDSVGVSEKMKIMWEKVNQKRADAIIEYEDHVKIIEFRHNVTPNAIGRILTYGMLWKDDPVIAKPWRLIIVSNRYDKDVERLSKGMSIEYYVV